MRRNGDHVMNYLFSISNISRSKDTKPKGLLTEELIKKTIALKIHIDCVISALVALAAWKCIQETIHPWYLSCIT